MNNTSINNCKDCDILYCFECTEGVNDPLRYCSKECEEASIIEVTPVKFTAKRKSK